MNVLDELRELLKAVLNIADNTMVRGQTKYNQLDRAVGKVITFCSYCEFADDKEANKALEMISNYKQAIKGNGWKLQRAIDRLSMDL